MKKLSTVLAVLIAVAALCAFGTAPASAASSELVIYCPHPLTFITPLVEAFQKQSGIKTEVITAGSGELLKRVEAEQANPMGDIFWGGSLGTMKAKIKLFENYKSANEGHVYKEFKNTEGSLTRFTDIPSVLMVNTNLIGKIKVEGYQDLLNPALKGKIAFADPSKSSSSFEHVVNILYGHGQGRSGERAGASCRFWPRTSAASCFRIFSGVQGRGRRRVHGGPDLRGRRGDLREVEGAGEDRLHERGRDFQGRRHRRSSRAPRTWKTPRSSSISSPARRRSR
jgi:hypothetical protein